MLAPRPDGGDILGVGLAVGNHVTEMQSDLVVAGQRAGPTPEHLLGQFIDDGVDVAPGESIRQGHQLLDERGRQCLSEVMGEVEVEYLFAVCRIREIHEEDLVESSLAEQLGGE